MLFLFKAFVSLLIVVNPIDSLTYFFALTADRPAPERQAIARTAVIAASGFLLASIWFGELVLDVFGISIGAFEVGGGLIPLLMAISMLQAKPSAMERTPAEAEEAAEMENIAVVPLAMPLIVGPGVISMAILLADESGGFFGRIELTVIAAVVMGILWWLLQKAEPVADFLGVTGANILLRVAGLILAGIAVQIIANGLVTLFPGLGPIQLD